MFMCIVEDSKAIKSANGNVSSFDLFPLADYDYRAGEGGISVFYVKRGGFLPVRQQAGARAPSGTIAIVREATAERQDSDGAKN